MSTYAAIESCRWAALLLGRQFCSCVVGKKRAQPRLQDTHAEMTITEGRAAVQTPLLPGAPLSEGAHFRGQRVFAVVNKVAADLWSASRQLQACMQITSDV